MLYKNLPENALSFAFSGITECWEGPNFLSLLGKGKSHSLHLFQSRFSDEPIVSEASNLTTLSSSLSLHSHATAAWEDGSMNECQMKVKGQKVITTVVQDEFSTIEFVIRRNYKADNNWRNNHIQRYIKGWQRGE